MPDEDPYRLNGDAVLVTHSVTFAAECLGAPSVRWVIDQIRAGRFPARKVGRAWRMTDQDIAEAVDACRNRTERRADWSSVPSGLTPSSLKRLRGAAS